MAFPSASHRRSLATALERAQSQADSLKRLATSYKASLAAGPVTGSYVLGVLDTLRSSRDVFTETAGLAGISEYAQAQLGQTVSSEFAAMTSAIDNSGSWIMANFPKDGAGFLLERTFAADGSRVERTFTAAQTAGLRTLLDTLIATID